MKQLTLKRFGMRFKHTGKVLQAAAESKRTITRPTPVSYDFLRLSKRYAQDVNALGNKFGVKVLSVNLHGSVKRGLVKPGSDVDINLFVRFKPNLGEESIKKTLGDFFTKLNQTADKRYRPLIRNEVKINVTVYPETELETELLSKPSHMYVLLTSKPLVGRKYYNTVRKEIINRIDKTPKMAAEILKSHEKVVSTRIKERLRELKMQ